MSELNIFGLREYYRRDIFEDTTDELREADKFYIMHEADAVIKDITEGAMSMFRESNRCRGLDTKSPLGRIADVAFKHWMYVERLKARLTEKDKEIAELKGQVNGFKNRSNLWYYNAVEEHKKFVQVDQQITELKAQKAQAEDDCAYWKTMAQKNAADNAVMAKQRAEALKRESHQKYKRCLAMAEWCDAEADVADETYKDVLNKPLTAQ